MIEPPPHRGGVSRPATRLDPGYGDTKHVVIVPDERTEDAMKNHTYERIDDRTGCEIENRRCDDVHAHGFHGDTCEHCRSGTGDEQCIFLKYRL